MHKGRARDQAISPGRSTLDRVPIRPQRVEFRRYAHGRAEQGVRASGSLEELKAKGSSFARSPSSDPHHLRPRRVFALDNPLSAYGFPLEAAAFEDGILTCPLHHARFDLESGCTFDLWADAYRSARSRYAMGTSG